MRTGIDRTVADAFVTELSGHEQPHPTRRHTGLVRHWFNRALNWLDRYWDDPERRSGVRQSGW